MGLRTKKWNYEGYIILYCIIYYIYKEEFLKKENKKYSEVNCLTDNLIEFIKSKSVRKKGKKNKI